VDQGVYQYGTLLPLVPHLSDARIGVTPVLRADSRDSEVFGTRCEKPNKEST
jgi:hypothetical protein